MNCKICSSNTSEVFTKEILGKYLVKYYQCNFCEFLQTEKPFWLEESYKNPINISDTGILERNLHNARLMKNILFIIFGSKCSYLDYSGGYGTFTRRMRDIGFDFFWHDPYTQNLFCRGFEFSAQKISAITLFEALEHFEEPMIEMDKIFQITKNVFFSTQTFTGSYPDTEKWDYYGAEHGQHISFYSIKSLRIINKRFNTNFYELGNNIYLFTEKKLKHHETFLIKSKILFKIMDKVSTFFLNELTYSDYKLIKNAE